MTSSFTSTALFFAAAILWQVLSHFIRSLMLKYYVSNGYQFEFSDEVYLYAPQTKLFEFGLGNLWSRRTDATFPVSWLADGSYILSCAGIPSLIFVYFYGVHFSIQDFDAELLLWITINLCLAISFNALRYRKFKHQIKNYVFSS